jgi:hypothetical protein
MKNKNYQQSKLKKQLREKKNNGVKILKWKLTPEKREAIESFGYYVEPYIYQINTRTFSNIRLIKSRLLKDLHYMNKRGKRFENRPLKEEEKEVLDEFGIKYRAVKYKIHLK